MQFVYCKLNLLFTLMNWSEIPFIRFLNLRMVLNSADSMETLKPELVDVETQVDLTEPHGCHLERQLIRLEGQLEKARESLVLEREKKKLLSEDFWKVHK